MTFVTVSVNREQLSSLSRLLVTLFPGCTIHQSRDPMRAIQRVSHKDVDAVFADVDTASDMMDLLRRRKMNTKIWLLCSPNIALPEELVGCYGVLSCPVTEHNIRNALHEMLSCI